MKFPKIKYVEIKIGSAAPNFTLPDQKGLNHKLSQYKGRWVLLYFYPKDDTPGCTKEACMIKNSFPEFKKIKAKIFGISVDSVASHKKFHRKYKLPFDILSDENKKIVQAYGVWKRKKFAGKNFFGTLRTSFLINPQGKIAKIYKNVKPEIHAKEVLNDLIKNS